MSNCLRQPLCLLTLLIVIVSSCGKYEEGPEFTLLTKKQRLVGEWQIEEATVNGAAVDPATYSEYTLIFERDGTARITYGVLTYKGTWEFIDDKKKLRSLSITGEEVESTILRLTNKQLWLKDPDGDIQKLKSKK